MKTLITGGCGFLGTNLAKALLARGDSVRILDDLSRAGTERNLEFLEQHPDRDRIEILRQDVRDPAAVEAAVEGVDAIAHYAAQVAVTTSVVEPRHDFEVNAYGTLNVLEAARKSERRPAVLFASTNKVYGGMEDVQVEEGDTRYAYVDLPYGASESQPLDFHSPYGCSKGAADQYVRDYSRIYDLPTVVFRTSCLYGPHQFGNEDQGWVAHFTISAAAGDPVNIFGDGKQIRDILHVDDAVAAYLAAIDRIDHVRGQVFNLGGGPENTVSLLELLEDLEHVLGEPVQRSFFDWRPGDQRVYVSDIRKLERVMGWTPKFSPREGVSALAEWVRTSGYFPALAAGAPKGD
jgi:CDP-paratose 2-epimerase